MNARAPYDAASDPRVNLTAEVLGEAQTNRFPIVASQFARRDRAGLMFGASIALLLGSATLFALSSSRQNAKLPPPQVAETPAAGLMAPAPGIVPPPPAPAAIAPPPVPAPVMAPPPLPQPPANNSMSGADRLRAPAVVFDSGANAGGNAPAMGPAAPAVAAISRPRPSREGMTPEEMFAERAAGKAESATADRMENPATTVAQGTLMAAVLETAINSDLPGYVRAVISQDVKRWRVDRSGLACHGFFRSQWAGRQSRRPFHETLRGGDPAFGDRRGGAGRGRRHWHGYPLRAAAGSERRGAARHQHSSDGQSCTRPADPRVHCPRPRFFSGE